MTNAEAFLEYEFASLTDFFCGSSSITVEEEPREPLVFTISNGAHHGSQEDFLAPSAPDSASRDHLGDATGLYACGERYYEVLTLGNLLKVDLATGVITLQQTVTASDAGSYTCEMKVYLAEFPAVQRTFQVDFKIVIEGGDASSGQANDVISPTDPKLQDDENCKIKKLVKFMGS